MTLAVGTCVITPTAGPVSEAMTPLVGTSPVPRVVGIPSPPMAPATQALDLVVQVTTGGSLGTGVFNDDGTITTSGGFWYRASNDGGSTWTDPMLTGPTTITRHGTPVELGSYGRENPAAGGVKVRFQDSTHVYVAGDSWTYALTDVAGTPSVTGTRLAAAQGAVDATSAWVDILAAGGCPLPNTDTQDTAERRAAVQSQIDGFMARATAKYTAASARAFGYAYAIVDEFKNNAVPVVGGVSGTLR